ncbi:MAG: tetratricopeptide repeat protein [Elusimicrobiota bacterium]
MKQAKQNVKLNKQYPEAGQVSHSAIKATVTGSGFAGFIIPALLSLLLLLNPLFPDVQITRPKLLLIEVSVFILLLAFVLLVLSGAEFSCYTGALALPVLVYVIFILVYYFLVPNRAVAQSELKRMLLCSVIFFISASALSDNRHRVMVIYFWIAGSFLSVVYGLFQHWGRVWIFEVPKEGRIYSTYGNPIFFAAHIVMLLPLVLGAFFQARRYVLKFLLLAVFASGLAALYWTQTRAAWIGFAVSIAIFGFLGIKTLKTRVIFLSVFLAVVAAFSVITWNVWLRHQAHPLIWKDTLNMWLHSPLFGTGPGTFHINFPGFASKELLSIWPQTQNIINDAHNEYLQILSETGVAGLGIFMVILFYFFRTATGMVKRFQGDGVRERGGTGERFIITGLLCSAVAILAQNVFSVDMRFIISAFYLFLAMGIVSSVEAGMAGRVAKHKLNLAPPVRYVLMMAVLAYSGVINVSRNSKQELSINFMQVLHFNPGQRKFSSGMMPGGFGLLPSIVHPYLAHKTLAEEVDFFDEKVLEPYKTISELEQLAGSDDGRFLSEMKISAAQLKPARAKIYEKLAWVYAKEKNFNKAIGNYMKSIDLNPGLPGPYNNLGNIYFLMNNRKEAIKFYRRSVEINPGQVDAYTNLGIAHYYEGQLSEAAAAFNRVIQLDPGNEKAIVMLKKMRE